MPDWIRVFTILSAICLSEIDFLLVCRTMLDTPASFWAITAHERTEGRTGEQKMASGRQCKVEA